MALHFWKVLQSNLESLDETDDPNIYRTILL